MPTYNRREFIGAAIACYQVQDYQDRELVILDDGEDKIADLIPLYDTSIKYHTCERTLHGMKQNKCIALTSGEIICFFDDDDWSAPGRISKQVELLEDKYLTVFTNTLFYDTIQKIYLRPRTPIGGCGSSLAFRKTVWEKVKFNTLPRGTDALFIEGINSRFGKQSFCEDEGYLVARIHDRNLTNWHGTGRLLNVTKDQFPNEFLLNEDRRINGHS